MWVWGANRTHRPLWTYVRRVLQLSMFKVQTNHFHFGWRPCQPGIFPHMSWMWCWERETTQLESHRGTLPQMRQEDEGGSWNDNNGRLKLYDYEKSSIISFIDFSNQYKCTDDKDYYQCKVCEVWTKSRFSSILDWHASDDKQSIAGAFGD